MVDVQPLLSRGLPARMWKVRKMEHERSHQKYMVVKQLVPVKEVERIEYEPR